MSDKNEQESGDWQVLSSHTIYNFPPFIRLEKQVVQLPDGKIIDDYHRLEMPEYCLICPYTDDGRMLTLRGYRHGVSEVIPFLPGGLIEYGEKPLDAAKRELLEETGYQSGSWKALGNYAPHGNYGCGRVHIFQARRAVKVQSPNSGDLEEMTVELNNVDTILDWISNGRVQTLGTLAAIMLSEKSIF
jgi:ADP-ribose pyrophosphatase